MGWVAPKSPPPPISFNWYLYSWFFFHGNPVDLHHLQELHNILRIHCTCYCTAGCWIDHQVCIFPGFSVIYIPSQKNPRSSRWEVNHWEVQQWENGKNAQKVVSKEEMSTAPTDSWSTSVVGSRHWGHCWHSPCHVPNVDVPNHRRVELPMSNSSLVNKPCGIRVQDTDPKSRVVRLLYFWENKKSLPCFLQGFKCPVIPSQFEIVQGPKLVQ